MADKKFIPDSDSDFACMARVFAGTIAENPGCYHLSASDAELISRKVQAFRDALVQAIRPGTKTKITVLAKDRARAAAEAVVRKYANEIRVSDKISHIDKMKIAVRERPRRLQRRKCPMQPPYLRFAGTENGARAVHLLEFKEQFTAASRAKPFGAVRLELFMGLVGPGERVPVEPEVQSGRAWYLRSYTANPIRVEVPALDEPRLVVYWGRWADATGAVGRFSQTAVARVEGWGASEAASEVEEEASPKPAAAKLKKVKAAQQGAALKRAA